MFDYTSATLRGAVKHRQTTRLNSDKKGQLKAERNGAFATKPLGESPRNSSHGGIKSYLMNNETLILLSVNAIL